MTYARTDIPGIYVERFGKPGAPLYLTVFNDTRQPQTASIALDRAALGMTAAGTPDSLRVTLDPEDVTVLTLAGPELRLP